jgi:hypothetical protein
MSTVAEKAAARRAKILAKSADRMKTVTGGMMPSELPSASPEELATARANAAAELDRALEEMDAPTTTTAKKPQPASVELSRQSQPSSSSTTTIEHADPHEFLSAEDAEDFSPPDSPSPHSSMQPFGLLQRGGVGGTPMSSDPFAALASLGAMGGSGMGDPFGGMGGFGGGGFGGPMDPLSLLNAVRKRKQDAAASSMDLGPPPPAVHPLTAWKRRVLATAKSTSPARALTVLLVLLVAALSAFGHVESGLAWLVVIEIGSLSVKLVQEKLTTAKTSKPASTPPRRPAAASPPSASREDGDVVDIDTDDYRTTPAPEAAHPFAAFGAGNLGSLQTILPPGMEGGLQALQILLKYVAFLKQLVSDGMLFIFVTIVLTAIWQLAQPERIVYTS